MPEKEPHGFEVYITGRAEPYKLLSLDDSVMLWSCPWLPNCVVDGMVLIHIITDPDKGEILHRAYIAIEQHWVPCTVIINPALQEKDWE